MASLLNNLSFRTTAPLLVGGSSVTISPDLELGQTVVFTDASIVFRNDEGTIIERCIGTATGGTLTLTKRGLLKGTTDTEDPALEKEWLENTLVYLTVLASQIADKKNDNSWGGKNTFEELEVTDTLEIPEYADSTARDTAIPSPNTKMIVVTDNVIQHYNELTTQREDLAIGTPPPPASETASGIIEIATDAETATGTDDTRAITPKKLQKKLDDLVIEGVPTEALVDKDTYILGEDCDENDLLFAETAPTFAEVIEVQNIGDVTANTRVVLYAFGSGIAGDTQKLALRKFVSPSASLSVRLETLDVSGNPTGTLVDANATATVTSASLTTSLVDTTITFTGSFTIPKGQKYAIVLNAVGDVVNGTNYYGVGYANKNTTTRAIKRWNGSAWSSISYTNVTDSYSGLSGGFGGSNTNTMVLAPKYNLVVVSQTVAFTITGGGINVTSLTPGVTLQRGVSYTFTFTNTTGWFNTGTFAPTAFDIVSASRPYLAYSIVTTRQDEIFPYVSSSLSTPTMLSKCDERLNYKIHTDFPRFANENKSAGEEIISTYHGLKRGFTGLSQVKYYASGVPGQITALGSNDYAYVGMGISDDTLYVGKDIDNIIAGTNYISGSSDIAILLNFTPTAVWTKMKEIEVGFDGTYTVEFDVQTNVSGNDSRGAMFINGIQVGVNRAGGGLGTWVSYSETATVTKGDLIQIYAQKTASGSTGIRNFRIKYSLSPISKPYYLSKTII